MAMNLNVPVSGLTAATKRVGAAAANIVNAGSTSSLDPVAPVSGTAPTQGDGQQDVYAGYRPVRIQQASVTGGGTRAVAREVDPSFVRSFDPDHPDADPDGIVKRPNVSLEVELTNLLQAKQAYRASLKTLVAMDEMLGTLLDTKT